MQTLDVALGERSYPIHVGPGLLAEAGALLAPRLPRQRAMVVSNPVVAALWLDPLREASPRPASMRRRSSFPMARRTRRSATLERSS